MRPFGLCGGGDAEPGLNLLVRAGGRTVNLGEEAFACSVYTRACVCVCASVC